MPGESPPAKAPRPLPQPRSNDTSIPSPPPTSPTPSPLIAASLSTEVELSQPDKHATYRPQSPPSPPVSPMPGLPRLFASRKRTSRPRIKRNSLNPFDDERNEIQAMPHYRIDPDLLRKQTSCAPVRLLEVHSGDAHGSEDLPRLSSGVPNPYVRYPRQNTARGIMAPSALPSSRTYPTTPLASLGRSQAGEGYTGPTPRPCHEEAHPSHQDNRSPLGLPLEGNERMCSGDDAASRHLSRAQGAVPTGSGQGLAPLPSTRPPSTAIASSPSSPSLSYPTILTGRRISFRFQPASPSPTSSSPSSSSSSLASGIPPSPTPDLTQQPASIPAMKCSASSALNPALLKSYDARQIGFEIARNYVRLYTQAERDVLNEQYEGLLKCHGRDPVVAWLHKEVMWPMRPPSSFPAESSLLLASPPSPPFPALTLLSSRFPSSFLRSSSTCLSPPTHPT
ncbi:hypothetical protein Naga_100496g1 [Nannochloropsis gaditana]|uniref:Uncharacterized protein n=1 Tax=Nannochloropsis gaditana TaxID=72520 RepID=W7T180_9STRA|nr:hypothetical protein Naga_100496g1 [Nannochloropsis gaditana]